MILRRRIPQLKIAVILITVTSCGIQRKTNTQVNAPSKKPQGLTYEHDELTNDQSPWVVTTPPLKTENANNSSGLLYDFIDRWEGTPHVWGGNTLKGVDCSGLVIQCYLQVYQKDFIGRRAEDLFGETRPVKKSELREGDLVFFKISGRRIDHVGVYLSDGNFVHTSSSRGVMVSNLSESYFQKRFFMGGRKS